MRYFVEEKIIDLFELLIEYDSTKLKCFLCSSFVLFIILIAFLDIVYYNKINSLFEFNIDSILVL